MSATTARDTETPEAGEGWVTFAGLMICIVAIMNLIYGIAAATPRPI